MALSSSHPTQKPAGSAPSSLYLELGPGAASELAPVSIVLPAGDFLF